MMMDIAAESIINSSGNEAEEVFPTLPEIPCLTQEVDHEGGGQKVPGIFMILYWIIMLLMTFIWLFWSLFLKKHWHHYCHHHSCQQEQHSSSSSNTCDRYNSIHCSVDTQLHGHLHSCTIL